MEGGKQTDAVAASKALQMAEAAIQKVPKGALQHVQRRALFEVLLGQAKSVLESVCEM